MWFYRLKGLGPGAAGDSSKPPDGLSATTWHLPGALAIYLARINSPAAATAEFQHALKGVQQRGFLSSGENRQNRPSDS